MADDFSIIFSPGETHLVFVSNGMACWLDEGGDLSNLSDRDLALLAAFLELAVKKIRPLIGERVL